MSGFLNGIININRNLLRLIRYLVKEIKWEFITRNVTNCLIDKNARIYGPCSISQVKIGYGTYIGQNAIISKTDIGKFCSIGPNVVCGWGIHPLDGVSTSPVFYSNNNHAAVNFSPSNKIEERKHIFIGNDVFVGVNVTILDGITIGDGAVIGAGAVVSKDIPPYAIAVGCPIQIIKYRFSQEIIDKLLETRWWDGDKTTFQRVEEDFFDIEAFIKKSEEIF